MDTTSRLSQILELRLLVAHLGEREQYSWWPTSFFGTSSRMFLEPVFARTTFLARYHGVVEAARCLHDEHLSVGCYHLFRLPEEVEENLHHLAQQVETQEAVALGMSTKDDALVKLRQLAGKGENPGEGPRVVGNIADLLEPATHESIAAGYLWAFRNEAKSYPYLAG